MSEEWSFVQFPGSVSQSATTPLKLRNPQVENLQMEQQQHKKRGPTTPLTPSLIQKNMAKKQTVEREEIDSGKNEGIKKTEGDNHTFNETQGSPKHRKSTPLMQLNIDGMQQATPKMVKGIKMAVKDHKMSRLQMLRQSESNVGNTSISSDADYSEISSISGDTPNYKVNNNLIYYKNGYYIDGDVDDSFYETGKENIIQSKELHRLNNVLEFMALEKKFENESV